MCLLKKQLARLEAVNNNLCTRGDMSLSQLIGERFVSDPMLVFVKHDVGSSAEAFVLLMKSFVKCSLIATAARSLY